MMILLLEFNSLISHNHGPSFLICPAYQISTIRGSNLTEHSLYNLLKLSQQGENSSYQNQETIVLISKSFLISSINMLKGSIMRWLLKGIFSGISRKLTGQLTTASQITSQVKESANIFSLNLWLHLSMWNSLKFYASSYFI